MSEAPKSYAGQTESNKSFRVASEEQCHSVTRVYKLHRCQLIFVVFHLWHSKMVLIWRS